MNRWRNLLLCDGSAIGALYLLADVIPDCNLSGATIRVLQESSKKYFNPDFIVCQLYDTHSCTICSHYWLHRDTPGDLIYNQVKAQFTERVHHLPSCVMEFKKDDVLGDVYAPSSSSSSSMAHLSTQIQGGRHAAANYATSGTLAEVRE